MTIGYLRIISDLQDGCFVMRVLIDKRLHAVVFQPRAGQVQGISLRKANPREVRDYEQKTKPYLYRETCHYKQFFPLT